MSFAHPVQYLQKSTDYYHIKIQSQRIFDLLTSHNFLVSSKRPPQPYYLSDISFLSLFLLCYFYDSIHNGLHK